jgi:hypothetical protein
MKKIVSYCGFICSDCMAYKDNIKNENDRKKVSDYWELFYNIKVDPSEVYCEGCVKSDEENPVRITHVCRIRNCTIKHKVTSCAYCDGYPCKLLNEQMLSFEKTEEKHKNKIPKEIYNEYFKPYYSRNILNKLNRSTGK